MKKHSLDLRHEAVKAYLAGNQGYRAVANRFGVGRTALRRWVATYKIHGLDNQKRHYQFYPIDFKERAVLSVVNGWMTVNEALAHYNIPANTSLLSWIRLYNAGGVDALRNKPRGRPKMSKQSKPKPMPEKPLEEMTREELLEELEYRRTEVAYLKKLKALVQSRQSATKPKH